MRTVFIVFTASFKRALNERKNFLINLFVPIAAIILAIFANYISTPSVSIGIIQTANFDEEHRIISLLEETKGIKIKAADKSLLKTSLILGKYDGIIDFKKVFKKGEITNIDQYFDFYTIRDINTKTAMKNLIKYYVSADRPMNINSTNSSLNDGALSKTARIISFLAMVLLITSTANASSIIKDKAENTFNRFMYSPSNRFSYILGNMFYNYVITYIQLLIVLVITTVLGMRLPVSLSTFLAYDLILCLLTTTFGTFVACLFKKELYANLFSSAISLILALIGGAFITYNKMPHGLQLISNITPNRWIIKSVDLLENGTSGAFNPIIVLGIFCIIFCAGSLIISKVQKIEFNS